jgi:adenosine deaminase
MTDREWMRRLPKAELHCHLDGSPRPETLLELGAARGVALPARDAPGIRAAVRAPHGWSLEAYLSCFAVTLAVLQTAEALERVAYEVAEDAAGDGAWYLELRFAPLLTTQGGLRPDAAVAAVGRGLRRAEAARGIICRIIVCALRQLSADASLEAARLAVGLRDEGVVGFDLAGPEAGHPAATHAAAFLYAREHDLSCTCHAGEADDARSVRQAVHRCGANRIGHATRMIEDAALTEYVADHGIAVEACLTSNVQTGAAASYGTHPLRALLERGVSVALCTDNRLVSDTTLVDEYAHAARWQGLNGDQLVAVARAGFAGAFLPWSERRVLLRRFDAAVDALPSWTAPP